MRTFLIPISLALLLAVAYLRASRSIAVKRWLLPATAAAIAALFAACFATYLADGTSAGYAVGLPLGLSAGCLLHHLLEYCHRCGATPSLRRSVQTLPHHLDADARRCHCRLAAFRR
jgi:hypothetical protein